MKIPRPSRTVVMAVVAALAVTGTALGLTAGYAYAGDVPRGTIMLGVDLGGMSRDEATAALQERLAEHAEALAAPVAVQIGEVTAELDPAEVGLAVDLEASVARAAASRPHPLAAVFGLFGSRELHPAVVVDSELLFEALSEHAEEAGEAMTLPEIQFEGTTPVPVYPVPGLGLDPERSAQAVVEGWPQLGDPSGAWHGPAAIAVPLVEIHPVTTAADVDRIVADLATPAVAAPVNVSTPDDRTFEVPPEVIAASLRLTADERGEIIPAVDPKALRKGLADALAAVETEPVDARVVFSGGAPAVRDSADGERVDTKALATELLAVLPAPAPREVTATVATTEPELDTEAAVGLGVKERVSSFTTSFSGGLGMPRNQNIALLAERVHGALVMPDEVFSLNGFTGPRGYDQGYQDAPVILNGRLQPAVGGGLSQFTTTLFNASYYAGLEDVEHHPHSYHYSRYPPVIEATIFYDSLDLKFRNNTPYGILIETGVTQSTITVSMWSTQVWDDVTTTWGPKRNTTQPKRMYVDPGPSCIATQGIEGFTQDAWRIFSRDGEEVEREKFSWRYDAQPEVICGEKPDS